MLKLIFLISSFLLGSIPFGFLAAHCLKGVDIRKFGSGNIGATNVFRVVGKPWGISVFILDFLKGLIPPLAAKVIFPFSGNTFLIFTAFLPVCGHNWTPFLKFKGGKGVATSLGGMVGLSFIFPFLSIAIGLALVVWFLVFKFSGFVSLGSLAAIGVFFLSSLVLPLPIEIKIFTFLLMVFIVIKHRKNIRSLLKNKENKF